MQLQNMLGSKFVGYFLGEILDWQRKLSTADAVINAWFEVQRAWGYLESIFIGSEDIRSQLPEETKRFEKIDREFKVCTSINCLLTSSVIFFDNFIRNAKKSSFLKKIYLGIFYKRFHTINTFLRIFLSTFFNYTQKGTDLNDLEICYQGIGRKLR